jgi:outer membrane receptor protein involved in Fe transport
MKEVVRRMECGIGKRASFIFTAFLGLQLIFTTAVGAQDETPPPPPAPPSATETPATAATAPAPEATAPAPEKAPPAGEKVHRMKPIIVTGSNIPTLEEQPVAPVLRIDREEIDRSGASTVAEVLHRIPQNAGNQSFGENQAGSFSPATAAISLRGFGPQSTLVLINGRRLPPTPFGDNFNGVQANFVDLNTIPLAAVERVEIEKDSGSAIYGSDAIGGVVNIILKQDYNGMEVQGSYGEAARSDIGEQTYSLLGGLTSGKSTLMIELDYFRRNSSFLRDRPISKSFAFFSSNGGQATFINPTNTAQKLYVPRTGAPNGFSDLSTNATTGNGPDANQFNTNIRTVDYPGTERYGGLSVFTYDITDNLQFFVDGWYRRSQTHYAINPTPIVGDQDGWTVGPNNPYNPFPGFATIVKWRLFQTGPRINDIDAESVYLLPGLRLKIGESWNVESAYSYSFDKRIDNGRNYLDTDALQSALNDTNPATALNPLAAPGQQNQATIDSLKVRTTRQGRFDFWQYDIKANGNVIDLPAGPVALALGAETRNEKLSDIPDTLSNDGSIVSQGGNHASFGQRDSDALYAELFLPVVSPQNEVPAIHSLQLQLAGRFEYYSDFGTTWKPKAGLKWQPTTDLAFRFSYSRGFRAPTLSELFLSPSVGFVQGVPDLARCMPQNTDPAAFDPSNDICKGKNIQYKAITGGNPNLNPENSESFYYETSYQPPIVKGLTVTLGYTHIKVTDVITAPNPAFIVANPKLFPGAVVRDANQKAFPGDPGPILSINSTLQNVNEEVEDAIDLDANYVKDTESIGSFTANLLANWTPNFQLAGATGGFTQQAGEGSFGPTVKGNFSLFWRGPKGSWAEKLGFGPTLNYWSAYHEVLFPPRTVRDWWTVDLQATYDLPWETSLTLGILNVADRNAPRSLGQNGEGYDNTVHDNRGRFVYFRVNKKL